MTTSSFDTRYPKVRNAVRIIGKGTAKERRIETNTLEYRVMRRDGKVVYVTIPQD